MSYDDKEFEQRRQALESRKRVRSSAGSGQTTRRTLGNDPYDRPEAEKTRQRTARPEETPVRKRPAATSSTPMKNPKGKKTLSPKAKKRRRNRRIIFAIEAILLLLVLFMCFVVAKWDLIKKASFGKKDVYVSELSDNVIESMGGYRNIAVFGIDEMGSHSDVIMIASINNATGEVKLVSVLRDTWWNTPDAKTGEENVYHKANNAYHTGGSLNALKALNKNLDLNITEYAEVNWVAVAKAVDILGGLDIDVPETMMGEINGYITNCVDETGYPAVQIEHSGLQHLQGMQVVAYCRIRHNNGGDDGRARRQREVVNQILERVKQVNPQVVLELCDQVFPEVTTNLSLANIIAMIPTVTNLTITEMFAFPYHQLDKNIDGASVKVPLGLAEDVTELHQNLFADYSYTPSDVVTSISNHIEAYTGLSAADR